LIKTNSFFHSSIFRLYLMIKILFWNIINLSPKEEEVKEKN